MNSIIGGKDLKANQRNFITTSWLKSYRNSPETKYLLTSIYKSLYWDYINNELRNSVVDIHEDKDIKAFCVYQSVDLDHRSQEHSGLKSIIKYIYTAYSYRNQGYAKRFMETYSHNTINNKYIYCSYIAPSFVKLCNKMGLSHIYLPHLKKL